MRESDSGRSEVFPWGYAQRVYGAIDDCPGTIISVDRSTDSFTVRWDGEDALGVTYPQDTVMVRRAFPWE